MDRKNYQDGTLHKYESPGYSRAEKYVYRDSCSFYFSRNHVSVSEQGSTVSQYLKVSNRINLCV